jgi:hypothetical protein
MPIAKALVGLDAICTDLWCTGSRAMLRIPEVIADGRQTVERCFGAV